MKFFVPEVDNEGKAEELYQATKKFAAETCWPVTDRRIQSIRFKDDGRPVLAMVGEIEPITGETVIAILESNTYLVCTPSRGVLRGQPILVGKREVVSVIDFDS
jgi:hypothetical protein